jgi:60 kDa SS-A/Ro ribonucleoprotein
VKEALQEAMEIALELIGPLGARVVVCPDVSGSMVSAVTGGRKGATSAVRCIDVAALVAAAIVRTNPQARVLPFAQDVCAVDLNPRDSVMTNAAKLAALGGGGTNCSAPLQRLLKERTPADLVVLLSDNQSWMDARAAGPTATLRLWEEFRARNPQSKLVCIDLQPNRTTQALERPDVLNIGGFSDEVFEVLARFAQGTLGAAHWVGRIEAIEL